MNATSRATDAEAPQGAWLAFFAAAGMLAFVAQTLLFREFVLLYQGSELVIGAFFGSWLVWVAVGAVLARWLLRRWPTWRKRLPAVALAYALAPLAQLVFMRALRDLVDVPAWQTFPPGLLLNVTLVGNAPVSLLTGALFALACAAADGSDGPSGPGKDSPVSRRTVVESLGSFAGGLGVTALLPLAPGDLNLLLVAMMPMLLAALWLALDTSRRHQAIGAGALVAGLVIAWCSGGVTRAELALEQIRWRGVLPQATWVNSCSTPYQHVAVGRLGEQLVVARNGVLTDAVPDDSSHAETASLLAGQHPEAQHLLLIGGAATGMLRHVLNRTQASVVWIDGDPAATACLLPHLPGADQAALVDRRVTILAGDARAALAGWAHRFDLIAVASDDLHGAHANRLHTVEFLRQIRDHLAPGGVLATRVSAEANYLQGDVLRLSATMDRTLRAVFAKVAVLPGEHQWWLAGPADSRLTVDATELRDRLMAQGVARTHIGQVVALLDGHRMAWMEARLAPLRQQAGDLMAPVNSDRHPAAYLLALAWHVRALGSRAGRLLLALLDAGRLLWLAPLLIFMVLRLLHVQMGPPRPRRQTLLWRQRLARFNARALLLAAGMLGMSLVTLWMFAFQARFGAIFGQVGLVGGLFVLGLAGGGGLAVVLLRRHRPAQQGAPWRGLGAGLLAAVVMTAGATPLMACFEGLSPAVARLAFLAAFLGSGAAVGALVPLAESLLVAGGGSVARNASDVEMADHLGGALAAAAMGLLWLPTLGVAGATALLVAGLGTVATLLVQQWWFEARAMGQGRAVPHSPPRWRPSWTSLTGIGIGLAAVVTGPLLAGGAEAPTVRFTAEQLRVWTDGGEPEARSAPFVHYLLTPGPQLALAASAAVAPEVQGYAGPLNLLVSVTADRRLGPIRLLATKDTPAYIVGLQAWLAGLQGQGADGRLRGHRIGQPRDAEQVDVLTGATVTSNAALTAINHTARELGSAGLGLESPAVGPAEAGHPLADTGVQYLLLSFVLAVLCARFAGPQIRRLLLLGHVVVGGWWLNCQLSTVELVRLVRLEWPGTTAPALWLLFFGVLALAALFGPLYCAHMCPFGAAQELLGQLRLAGRLHHRLEDGARKLKYLLLLALVVTVALAGDLDVLASDPLRLALGRQASGLTLFWLAGLAVASILVFRPWCRYLCPVGAGLNLMNHLRLLGRWLRPRSYGSCDLGIDSANDPDCLQCDRCIHRVTLPPPDHEVQP